MVKGLRARLVRIQSCGKNACKTWRGGSVSQGMSLACLRPKQERRKAEDSCFSRKGKQVNSYRQLPRGQTVVTYSAYSSQHLEQCLVHFKSS